MLSLPLQVPPQGPVPAHPPSPAHSARTDRLPLSPPRPPFPRPALAPPTAGPALRPLAGDPSALATLSLGGTGQLCSGAAAEPAAAAAFLPEEVSPLPLFFCFSHTFYFIL